MEDLREVTHSKHYELYRQHKLEEMGFSDSESKRFLITSFFKSIKIVHIIYFFPISLSVCPPLLIDFFLFTTLLQIFFFTIASLSETYEQKRQEHITMLQKKEDEMRQMFVIRVKEKEAELKEAEKEVRENLSLVYREYQCYLVYLC